MVEKLMVKHTRKSPHNLLLSVFSLIFQLLLKKKKYLIFLLYFNPYHILLTKILVNSCSWAYLKEEEKLLHTINPHILCLREQ